MKMKFCFRIILIVISTSFFLNSCAEKNEEEVNLEDGIYYIPSQEATFDQIAFDGNGIYTYKKNSIVPLIYPKIEEFKYDSLYIIV